jgi:hypothetical protein
MQENFREICPIHANPAGSRFDKTIKTNSWYGVVLIKTRDEKEFLLVNGKYI